MPIYEYRCQQCGALFEKLRKATEADREAECPQCGSKISRRQFSSFATGGCGGGAGRGGFT